MSSLRCVCAAACLAFAIPVIAEDTPPRLVDFAGDAAVFEIDGRAAVIRTGHTLPGLGATLRHVGKDSIVVEVSAARGRESVLIELARGEAMAVPDGADMPVVVMPSATMLPVEPEPSAAGRQR